MPPVSDTPRPVATIRAGKYIVTGTFRYADAYSTAIALVESGRIDLDIFASKSFDLSHVADALKAPGADPSIVKALVIPRR